MIDITFEDRAVAFIDVLGFKNVVYRAAAQDGQALATLNDIVSVLTSTIPFLDGKVASSVDKSLIPSFTYISDSVILSAPISSPLMRNYNGLNIVVMRAIQLSHAMLGRGFIFSGGISIGKVWHTKTNIVGPAYIDAYKMQSSLGAPRIQLTKEAAALWDQTPNAASTMCIQRRSGKIVNIAHDYYIPDNHVHGAIEARISNYRSLASENIRLLKSRPRRKWQWHSLFLQRYAHGA